MTRRRLSAGLAALMTLGLASAASADRTVVSDPKGDTRSPSGTFDAPFYDIRKAIAAHADDGKLRHVVQIQDAKSFSRRSIEIQIKVGEGKGPRYVAYMGAPGYRGDVVDLKENKVTGEVEGRGDGNRFTLIFRRRAIGDPGTYRWRALTWPGGDSINSDYAPNKGFKPHHLAEVKAAASRRVTGPNKVKPGTKVTFRAKNFEPDTDVSVQLQPTENRGGNGVGRAITKAFHTGADGNAKLRFRFPERYYRCSSSTDCSKYRWEDDSKVDVNVCADVCKRKVTRIKKD